MVWRSFMKEVFELGFWELDLKRWECPEIRKSKSREIGKYTVYSREQFVWNQDLKRGTDRDETTEVGQDQLEEVLKEK